MSKEDPRAAQLTVRIPQYLRDALEREAKRDRRSIADVVVYALEAWAQKRTTKGGK